MADQPDQEAPGNLVVLPTLEAEVDANVVEVLETVLAMAKRGEVTSVAAACTLADGDVSTSLRIPPGRAVFSLLGALKVLERRVLRAVEEEG